MFTYAVDAGDRRRAAIDTDIFLDLVESGRPIESTYLEADWLHEHLELISTKTLASELHNHNDGAVRARHRRQLTRYRRIDGPVDAVRRAYDSLAQALGRAQLSPHDRFDLEHVARAVAAGADYFVSRDDALHKRLAVPARELGIGVVRPVELITELAAELGTGAYAPVQVENTRFVTGGVSPDAVPSLVETFVSHRTGERANDLRRQLSLLAADQEGAFSKFAPPQSFRYVTPGMARALAQERWLEHSGLPV